MNTSDEYVFIRYVFNAKWIELKNMYINQYAKILESIPMKKEHTIEDNLELAGWPAVRLWKLYIFIPHNIVVVFFILLFWSYDHQSINVCSSDGDGDGLVWTRGQPFKRFCYYIYCCLTWNTCRFADTIKSRTSMQFFGHLWHTATPTSNIRLTDRLEQCEY